MLTLPVRTKRLGPLIAAIAVGVWSCRPDSIVRREDTTPTNGPAGARKTLALGDSLIDSVRTHISPSGSSVSSATLAIQLSAGDTVDIGAWRLQSLASLALAATGVAVAGERPLPLTVPVGVPVGPGSVYPAIIIPVSATYLFKATAFTDLHCSGGQTCDLIGRYVVRARRAAPVVGVVAPQLASEVVKDSNPVGSLRIWNAGVKSVVATLSTDPPLLDATPATLTLSGPTPAGSATVVALSQVAGLQFGEYNTTLRYAVQDVDSVWSHGFRTQPLSIRVQEASDSLTLATIVYSLVRAATGDLVASYNQTVAFVNRATGVLTNWQTPLGGQVYRVSASPGGAVFAAVSNGGLKVYRLRGQEVTNFGAAGTILLAPSDDNTIFGLENGTLTRTRLDSNTKQVVKAIGVGQLGIVFSPVDSALYYVMGAPNGSVRRFDLRSNTEATIRSGSYSSSGSIDVDARGCVYVSMPNYSILVLDTQGRQLDERWPPRYASSFIIDGDRIRGIRGGGSSAKLWSLPLRDYGSSCLGP